MFPDTHMLWWHNTLQDATTKFKFPRSFLIFSLGANLKTANISGYTVHFPCRKVSSMPNCLLVYTLHRCTLELPGTQPTHQMCVQAVINYPHITDWYFSSKLSNWINHRLYKTLDAEWHWCRYEYQARKNIPSVCTFVEKAVVGWLASNRHQVLDDIDVVNDEWLIQEGEVAKTAVLEYADWLVATMNNSIPDEPWRVPVSASPLHFEYYGPWRYWLPWYCQHSAKTYKM